MEQAEVGDAGEGEAGGHVVIVQAVAIRFSRAAYPAGALGREEKNKVRTALKLWLGTRCTWPSDFEFRTTLDHLTMGATETGVRLSGRLLLSCFDSQTALEAVSMLASLEIAEETALRIFAGSKHSKLRTGDSSAATTPAAAPADAAPAISAAKKRADGVSKAELNERDASSLAGTRRPLACYVIFPPLRKAVCAHSQGRLPSHREQR
jgi:hypothetical protein